jgi:hypothetical protein
MSRYGITVMCVVLTVLLGVSVVSAQTGGAMLYAVNGDVRVNGQSAGHSTGIFAGDKIEVPASTAGSINLAGSSVVVSPNSSVQYSAANIEVLQGGARVSTSKGMSASVGSIVVAPKDASAKFDVVSTDNKVVVVSREGALVVKDGSRTMVVPSGSSTELPLQVAGVATAATAVQAASAKAPDFLSSERMSEHPFYGVVNGVDSTPNSMFPPCADINACIRGSISGLRPCCCPNSPPYCVGPPPLNPQK